MAMLFAWLFPVAMTVRAIVREKETRLKEYIKMVGVSDTQIRLSRLIVSGNQGTRSSCQPPIDPPPLLRCNSPGVRVFHHDATEGGQHPASH